MSGYRKLDLAAAMQQWETPPANPAKVAHSLPEISDFSNFSQGAPSETHSRECGDGGRLASQAAPARDASATEPSTQEACTSQEHLPPPPYPGQPIGTPFRPGQQVWLYRFDDHTPRFDAPVTIVQLRTLWPGEQDIGWCDAAGEVTWHNARLAVTVETQQVSP